MDITPGQTVAIELTAAPRNAAAFKTLTRLFRRDPQVVQQQRRQSRQRPSWQQWRRGGRMWHHQMKTKPCFALTVGKQMSLRVSVDIIRDLQSVSRWVKVTPQ